MKIQMPFHGHAAGRSGNTIFQTYWGNTYTRSMPILFHYPNTPAQQATQAIYYNIRNLYREMYRNIRSFVHEGQRHNVNIYNLYFKAIFQVCNPYDKPELNKPLQNFGLDELNRVILPATVDGFSISGRYFYFHFHFSSPTIRIQSRFNYFYALAVNRSKKQFYTVRFYYSASTTQFSLALADSWSVDDDILLYFALQGSEWFGNFNIAKR